MGQSCANSDGGGSWCLTCVDRRGWKGPCQQESPGRRLTSSPQSVQSASKPAGAVLAARAAQSARREDMAEDHGGCRQHRQESPVRTAGSRTARFMMAFRVKIRIWEKSCFILLPSTARHPSSSSLQRGNGTVRGISLFGECCFPLFASFSCVGHPRNTHSAFTRLFPGASFPQLTSCSPQVKSQHIHFYI